MLACTVSDLLGDPCPRPNTTRPEASCPTPLSVPWWWIRASLLAACMCGEQSPFEKNQERDTRLIALFIPGQGHEHGA